MTDTKRLHSIGESSGDLPDVSELHPSVFLDDVEANNMNVLDIWRSSSMQQNVFRVSVEEFEVGRVYRGVGSSNPGVNANVVSVGTNANRVTGPSNSVINVVPKPVHGRVEYQVNEFKGKHLTCELDVARHKVEVERLVREKKEVRDRLVSLDQEVVYVCKVKLPEVADVPCSRDGATFHVARRTILEKDYWLPVTADDYSCNTKATNDVAPYELEHLMTSYCCYWLGFHPFGEIFDGDDQEFDSSQSFRKWSYYVDSPFIEGPWARDAS
ncbi:hypothetical protein Tco_0033119 [Tanacetum coccineum]